MKNRKGTPQDPRVEIPRYWFVNYFKPKVQTRISAMTAPAAGKVDVANYCSRRYVTARAYQRIHRLVGASHPGPESGDRVDQLDGNDGFACDVTRKGDRARPDRVHALTLCGREIHSAMPGTES